MKKTTKLASDAERSLAVRASGRFVDGGILLAVRSPDVINCVRKQCCIKVVGDYSGTGNWSKGGMKSFFRGVGLLYRCLLDDFGHCGFWGPTIRFVGFGGGCTTPSGLYGTCSPVCACTSAHFPLLGIARSTTMSWKNGSGVPGSCVFEQMCVGKFQHNRTF